ncbi:MAG: DUF3805 domain-containing protein [Mucilaginibacter sp.]
MDYWEFVSDNKLFSLKLPENWSEYDDGSDDVFAFFNTDKWSGNLRISHLYVENSSAKNDIFLCILDENWMRDKNAVRVKLNNRNAAFYTNEATGDLMVHTWVLGSKNDLFNCSFTFDKSFQNSDWHDNELMAVAEILGSLKTTNV